MTNTQAWDYAIGLIKVDGLEPTKDFKECIEKEKTVIISTCFCHSSHPERIWFQLQGSRGDNR